jgi:hypothetical protein
LQYHNRFTNLNTLCEGAANSVVSSGLNVKTVNVSDLMEIMCFGNCLLPRTTFFTPIHYDPVSLLRLVLCHIWLLRESSYFTLDISNVERIFLQF